MDIKFYHHTKFFWTLEIDKKLSIGCDPCLEKSINKNFKNISLWLITEASKEHINSLGAELIENNAKIIARKECGKFLRDKKNSNIQFLDWFNKREFFIDSYKITVIAIPTFRGHSVNSKINARKTNGYFISILKKNKIKNIYITGDSYYHPDISKSLSFFIIDLLIANIGESSNHFFSFSKTMDLPMLNSFIANLKPEKTITVKFKKENK